MVPDKTRYHIYKHRHQGPILHPNINIHQAPNLDGNVTSHIKKTNSLLSIYDDILFFCILKKMA